MLDKVFFFPFLWVVVEYGYDGHHLDIEGQEIYYRDMFQNA